MEFDPPVFAQAPIGTDRESACSPRIEDPRFRGIVIAVPGQARAGTNEPLRLPVCGKYRLATFPLLAGAELRLHLRSIDRPEPIVLSVPVIEGVDEQVAPEPPQPPPDPRLYANQVSTSFFNLDAQRYLPQALPPGTYEVCVTYGRDQSNVARVTITRR